jgi:hypothetical protein
LENGVGEEKISLELLGSRLLTMTAGLRDLQLRVGALDQRFSAMEARFGALESRFSAQEEQMAAMLALLVRVAERIGTGMP